MQAVEEEVSVDLRLDEDEVDEEDDKIVLYVFVCKSFASWALHQSHVAAQSSLNLLAFGFLIFSDFCFFTCLGVTTS